MWGPTVTGTNAAETLYEVDSGKGCISIRYPSKVCCGSVSGGGCYFLALEVSKDELGVKKMSVQ